MSDFVMLIANSSCIVDYMKEKLLFISDIHIHHPGDKSYNLFNKFLTHSVVKTASDIFLVGDIFHFLMGDKDEYLDDFGTVFENMKALMDIGINIHFFEGNHDMNINGLVLKIRNKYNIPPNRFYHYRGYKIFNFFNKKILVSHGDEFEGNLKYLRYKRFVTGFFMEKFIKYALTYKMLNKIGNHFSTKSRERNHLNVDAKSIEIIGEKFRHLSEKIFFEKDKPDYIILGHSHFKENYESISGFTYLNTGDGPTDSCFIELDSSGHKFVLI